jgi:TolB-like protein/Tfp pilus assembly protein PilF
MALPAGTRLGPYEILSLIGAGGMGEVYKGRDTRLDRIVAVKVSSQRFSERFAREARAVAALNHPNICTLYDVGPDYLVMEYVEGASPAVPLPLDQFLRCALQMADALAAAHAKGIVHRDLKPGNIFITPDGRVKLLDFGLAMMAAGNASPADATETAGLTDPGTAVGTIAYMSPEQARGQALDARTDLWSLGVVLYELATGARPFEGTTQASIFEGVLSKAPIPASARNPKVPLELNRVIGKLLEKDRALRYQSAADLLADLKRVERDSTSGTDGAPPAAGRSRRWYFLAAAALAVLAILAAAVYYQVRRPPIDSLAVLPFVNASGNADADYLSDGITESLIGSLSRLPGLRVRSASTVFRYKGRNTDARQAARDLDVRAVVTGRIVQRGDSLALSAELVDTRDDSELWGEHYDRKMSDLVTVQQEIAAQISEKLRLRLGQDDRKWLAKPATADPEAYRLYLKGMYFAGQFSKDGIAKGLDYLRQAISVDPNYALAYHGLAYLYAAAEDLYYPPREAMPKAKEAAMKALELDAGLAEAHTDLGAVHFWYDYDWAAAEKELNRAIELNPSSAYGHETRGNFLVAMGRMEAGIAASRKAQDLDPLSFEATAVLGLNLYFARRYNEAEDQLRKAVELNPYVFMTHAYLGLNSVQQGKPLAAIEAAQNALRAEPDVDVLTAGLAAAYVANGNRAAAQKLLDELNAKSRRGWVPSYAFVSLYTRFGDKDRALAALERSYQERSQFVAYLKVGPDLDSLRSEPRFQALLQRLNFPQ